MLDVSLSTLHRNLAGRLGPGDPFGSTRSLLHFLLDAAIVHPEEWTSLPADARARLDSSQDRSDLLRRLTELSLLNSYQAARVEAGTTRGLVLGNYRVLGSMGSGGMGIVFAGEHLLMRRPVAIKVMPVDAEMNPGLITRFVREMRAVARLDHPNIVAAFDAGVSPRVLPHESDLYYFVMEHLEGKDLEQQVESGPLPVATACNLIYQVASALDEAHTHQLVHRDIKPSNIFVTVEGTAKLLDFGLVRQAASDNLTSPGVLVGTLEFMAPEQITDARKVDIRTDIFSLGATLFFALTGESPFPPAGSLIEMIGRRKTQPPPSASLVRPEIPEGLDALLQQMMALAPADRPATPQAVMNALMPFVESSIEPIPRCLAADPDATVVASLNLVKRPRVLILDADAERRRMLQTILFRHELECFEWTSPANVIDRLREDRIEVVLYMIDGCDEEARQTLAAWRDSPPCPNLKVVMTSAVTSADKMTAWMTQGADDWLCLPMSEVQLAARVKAAIRQKEIQDRTDRLSQQLLEVNAELERKVSVRMTDLVQARDALVLALARLVEYRANETMAHLTRMQRYCSVLAREAAGLPAFAAQIDEDFLQMLACCVPLHDLGNASLPDDILFKPGLLLPHERQVMQTHTTVGADILQRAARRFGSGAAFLGMAIDIARHHHEHYDGTGYPDGLAGAAIPLAARIVLIADMYDSLRSRRPQRPGLAHAATLQVMLESSAGKCDPLLLGAFQQCATQFERIFRDVTSSDGMG